MKLEFTWNSILKANAYYEVKEKFLAGFKDFDPTAEPDRPINLLKLLEINGIEHAIWALRANIQQDLSVTVSFSRNCADRAAAYAANAANVYTAFLAANDHAYATAFVVAENASHAAARAEAAAVRATYASAASAASAAAEAADDAEAERELQKQDLIKLLQE